MRFQTLWLARLMTALLAASIWTPTQAEPNAVTKYLLNEPVTMLDLGMFQLDQSLDNEKHHFMRQLGVEEAHEGDFDLGANYDLDNNKIKISIHCFNCGLPPDEKLCQIGMKLLRDNFVWPSIDNPNSSSLKLGDIINMSTAMLMFHHLWFRSTSKPEDFDERLAKMMTVEVELFSNGDKVTCEGGLFEKGYSVIHK